MNILVAIALWLLIIVVATAWHELGHYWAARAQGVAVKSFSVGMGPIIYRKMIRGTEWRVSALPIGGYVEIDGMAPDADRDGKLRAPTRGFAKLGALGKIVILLMGPIFNLLLALPLLAGYYTTQGVTTPLTDRASIGSVTPNSLAQRVGVEAGDVIVAIDGRDIPDFYIVDGKRREGYRQVQDALALPGRKSFSLERDGRTRDVTFDWNPKDDKGERRRFGISYGPAILTRQVAFLPALGEAVKTMVTGVPLVLQAFGNLVGNLVTLNTNPSADSGVSGPVRTVETVGQAAQLGAWSVLGIAALINLSLALFNLIPIPGLDGGRILLVLVQSVLRRPLSFEQENFINFLGFAFVLVLMVFVVFSDVARFF
ncbi:M50 family metallopeptidase [Deinococcus yavapaiensis]|uniref:Regulator of sigma E protease n=1 Tax=Deinococcus yavapaiensis KR-236 TaxID=694435 RepID=A0A318S8I3_9DEIO|nr:M50 family metallopeptidase [Deinococcus yavapaiensis]PYE54425.1 regulator of sigma E protease [Deinococcus yavapaiensis KR-236]